MRNRGHNLQCWSKVVVACAANGSVQAGHVDEAAGLHGEALEERRWHFFLFFFFFFFELFFPLPHPNISGRPKYLNLNLKNSNFQNRRKRESSDRQINKKIKAQRARHKQRENVWVG